jgi:outer membrane protein
MRTIILAAVLMANGWANAQSTTFTLKDCIETGIKNNLEVMQSNLDAEVAKANWQQAKANLYPDLNGYVTHGKNQGRSIDPYTNQYINQNVGFANYSMSSGVILFNGLRQMNTLKQRSLGLKAAEMDLQQQKDDLTIRIILRYLEVLRNQDQLVQAKNQAELSQKQVERLNQLNSQGAISPALLTDLQGDLGTNQLTILDVSNAVETSKIELSRLMNIPYLKNMMLEPLDPSMFALDYG